MRRVVTGLDESGKSTVISDGEPPRFFRSVGSDPESIESDPGAPDGQAAPPAPEGGAVVFDIWSLGTNPVINNADPTIAEGGADWDVPAGQTKWIVTQMGPNLHVDMHSTPTVDYMIVMSGTVSLGLETGPVQMSAGDVALVNGVEHSWDTGLDGCTVATILVGLSESER